MEKTIGEWTVMVYRSALGDTGDYNSECCISNGQVELFCYDNNFNEEEGLEDLCQVFNSATSQSSIIKEQAERIEKLEAALRESRTGYVNLIDYEILTHSYKKEAEQLIDKIDNALK